MRVAAGCQVRQGACRIVLGAAFAGCCRHDYLIFIYITPETGAWE
jgi:hypothetical protein